MIALAERGKSRALETVQEGQASVCDRDRARLPAISPVLTVKRPKQADLHLTGCFAMIELIEDFCPDHPLYPADPFARAGHRDMMETGRQIQHHLSAATRAQ
jgi:hypothetical protein